MKEREQIFDSSGAMLCLADFKGYFKRVSSIFTTVLGWSEKELLSRRYLDFVHSDDRPAAFKAVQEIIDGKEVAGFKSRYLCKDGSYKVISWSAFPMAKNGLIFAAARDMTEEKAVETALKISETEKRLILESIKDLVVYQDIDNRIIWANSSVAEAFGKTVKELKGAICYKAFHHKDEPCENCPVTRSVKSGRLEKEEMISPDGRQWIISGSPIKNASGSVIGVVEVAIDITERKKAEEALKKSEEEYRLLFESNPHPMWVYDFKTLKFIAANDAAVSHYGYSKAEFLSMTIKDIRPKEDVPRLLDNIKKVKVSGGFDNAGIWCHRKKDGTLIDVEIASHTITFAGRAVELVLANDITERRKVEKLKESLIRDISHELKTPVAILAMAHDMTARALARGNMKQVNKTQAISRDCIRRLRRDIANILQFSLLEKVKENKLSGIASLRRVVNQVMPEIKLIAGEGKDITFRINIPLALDKVAVTENHLHILLYNVLENAVKFTEKGAVTLRCSIVGARQERIRRKKERTFTRNSGKGARKERLAIVIQDTGCGISVEQQSKVFIKFFKEHTAVPGTGLGLVICKDIVQMYAGTIKVESPGARRGTKVTITLPKGNGALNS